MDFKGELIHGEAAALGTAMSGVEQLITKILKSKTIAVVGLSKNLSRANPTIDEVLGETSYWSLLAVPEQLKREVDVVDIFRRGENVPRLLMRQFSFTEVWVDLEQYGCN